MSALPKLLKGLQREQRTLGLSRGPHPSSSRVWPTDDLHNPVLHRKLVLDSRSQQLFKLQVSFACAWTAFALALLQNYGVYHVFAYADRCCSSAAGNSSSSAENRFLRWFDRRRLQV